MNTTRVKLVLDIVMGTVVPILILNNLNEHLGTVGAYVAAALVPAAWVLIDLFFITKRFNFITSYIGASAIMSGLLTFWFVDGIRFAVKDSFGSILTVMVFGGSLIVGRPMMHYFFAQALYATSPRQVALLKGLFEEPTVSRAIRNGTILILGINVAAVIANFLLNLRIVTADFGTTLFNQQVAQVNAVTRIALSIPGFLGLAIAIVLIRRAITHYLPEEEDEESDLWDLLELRAADNDAHPRTPNTSRHGRGAVSGFSGNVLIVGAGAAGLTAGHFLSQQQVSFQVLEATSRYGGRMKKTDSFADFPIPLGAEWLTADADIFDTIVNDDSVAVAVRTTGYTEAERIGLWKNNTLSMHALDSFRDRKFVHGTWFDFFERYVVPSVARHIVYNAAVRTIDYTDDTVIVRTQDAEYTADAVIVTAPLPVIRTGLIEFVPPLPRHKLQAVKRAVVWDGMKVFLEFSEKFYPAYTDLSVTPKRSGHVTYFDAAYGQQTDRNILGLFAVGNAAQRYMSLSDGDLKRYILRELDSIFSNKATPSYLNHIVQNWSDEPYIQGAYLNDYEDWKRVRTLSEPVANRIYFAGDAYTSGNDWGNVHDAARAARRAVRAITH